MRLYCPLQIYRWQSLEINGKPCPSPDKNIVGWMPVYQNKNKIQKDVEFITMETEVTSKHKWEKNESSA